MVSGTGRGKQIKGDAEKALAAGCDVYMAKPINVRELWARVDAFLPDADE